MHFQGIMVFPKTFLFLLVLPFESGFCIFKSWFDNAQQNATLADTQPFLKRQATLETGSNIDITTPMEFGEECEVNGRSCNENMFLDCIDGKCMCKNPMSHAFDEDQQQCVGLSGSLCGTGKSPCVKNSQCVFGSCQCLDKYRETSTKVCMMNHNVNCQPGECNPDANLACMAGVCQCIDGTMVYDPFSRKCLNPQVEFDKFTRTIGRDVVQRVIARTVSDATSLLFLPLRLLVPALG